MIELHPHQLHLVRGGAASGAPSTPGDEIDLLIIDAIACGRRIGEQQHYRSGWRWGVVCGIFAGLLLSSAAVVLGGVL
jgi:hypothetical protein